MTQLDWRDKLRAISLDSLAPSQDKEEKEAPKSKPDTSTATPLRVIVERRNAGKIATIITGFEYDDPRAEEVAAGLKRKLAVGGSVRDGEILLQGDRRQRVTLALRNMGYKVK